MSIVDELARPSGDRSRIETDVRALLAELARRGSSTYERNSRPPAPSGFSPELTHRARSAALIAPTRSNSIARQGELDTETWKRVFSQAAAIGILQLHLSGGEPASRRDLVEIVAHCARALASTAISSPRGLASPRPDDEARRSRPRPCAIVDPGRGTGIGRSHRRLQGCLRPQARGRVLRN